MQPTPPDRSPLDLELDALLAEMSGTGTGPTRADVLGRVRRLLASITTGATADRGSAPGGRAPAAVVEHDAGTGALFAAFDPDVLGHVVKDSTTGGIVQLVITHGGLGLGAATLAEPVEAIKERLLLTDHGAVVVPDERPQTAIVLELVEAKPKLAELRAKVGDPDLDLPLPQAAAVLRFLDTYPDFWGRLTGSCTITFNSSRADQRGGGLYEAADNRIFVSRLLATPPGAFLRLVVHETGHATFETALLGRRSMPVALDTHSVAALPARFADLGPGQAERLVLSTEDQEVRDLQSYWDAMSPDARKLYHAWLTLRAHRDRLLGLDLWRDPARNRLSPDHRRGYQAGKFSEFCAEVFMLYALGDLQPHVEALLADGRVEPEVKTAWRNAWSVLVAVADPVLGQRVG
ncbi:hypothetical protein ABZ816_19315 [Actinosynnema sp. NPDC047251]|uniref:Uncharacterized protein n=1 Tax=Saccharothrix espanaensis (strain ATCC 51144 / DSM 44229 / JCM 9112 / NBRC 15066 / NRRL 15764) TaxID=1179773 RepID=K0JZ06_SACES|nr:hypothetical protein [Saccharothrix espanaensis]CCH33190.1 hypothetical protein BN6_59330 [Saccharothrix espanaensis DSM 44229]